MTAQGRHRTSRARPCDATTPGLAGMAVCADSIAAFKARGVAAAQTARAGVGVGGGRWIFKEDAVEAEGAGGRQRARRTRHAGASGSAGWQRAQLSSYGKARLVRAAACLGASRASRSTRGL